MEEKRLSYEEKNSTHSPSLRNPEYYRLDNKIGNLKKRGFSGKSIRSLLKKRDLIRSKIPNPKFVRIKYIRYADD